MSKYDYLKKYIDNAGPPPRNWFTAVNKSEIQEAEEKLGFAFPESLKEFWLEIGRGCFRLSSDQLISADGITNSIMPPLAIAEVMINEGIGSEYGYFIHPHAFENLEESRYSEKDIVFFDVMDSYDFFVMKPDSPKPDAIYDIYGCEIEESFEKFIWRLYYDSPTYYLDINKEEYEEEQRQEELRQAEIAKRLQEAPARGVAWEYIRRNYQQLLKDKGLHEEFEFGGEPYAEHILREFKDQIESNYCPNCGHLKKTPKARQCLQCGEFHDVKLI